MANFAHLHVHTQYSLLDGASKPAQLLSYAKGLGMDSLAITDHGNMYGAVNFYQEAKKQGIKPIIGCEVYLAGGSRLERDDRSPRYHLILLAENNRGYQNLARLVSLGYIEGFYRKPRIDKELLRKYSEGLICLSACVAGEIPRLILQDNLPGAEAALREYVDIFGPDNFFLEMQNHDLPEEAKVNPVLKELGAKYGIGLVCSNDIHYVKKEDAGAQDVLLCIQTNTTVDDPRRMRFNNDHYYCKSYEEMLAIFPEDEEALHNTQLIADRCNVDFTFGKLLLPEFPIPDQYGADSDAYLKALCLESLPKRYRRELAQAEEQGAEALAACHRQLTERLDYELGIIKTMGYSCYFLIVWDFINYCRSHVDAQGSPDPIPVGPGRGSAAGSIVAFLLHITNIDPLKYDLLFERFLNPERVSMPDIDTDFCYKRRGEVMDYVIRKYGADHVALIITFGTLQARAAVRDVGRALGVSLPETDRVAKAVPKDLGITLETALKSSKDFKAMYDSDPKVKQLIDLAQSVEGLPRNSGTHAAGVVIAPKPLIDLVPLQLAEATKDEGISQDRMITTQYDKDKVEQLGLLKMDFLGLRTLTVLADALHFIKAGTGVEVDLEDIPLEDKETAAMLCRGDTQGVFQLESAGMTRLLMDLGPTGFRDLIPLVALYRPGPLGTGMAKDFINGRHGNKTAPSLHPLLDQVLDDTYGVVLYQEQVMKITNVMAGFSLGEADILRRAMGKKKAKELDSMKERFMEGALQLHNISKEKSAEVFGLLQHFAGYGFNKSHSVAYALVAYQTAYLKAHWPAEYFAALISSVVSDADKMSWYITVCRERGIKVLSPDVNASFSDFSVENGDIRFGLSGIKSVGDQVVEDIVKARTLGGPFKNILDFCKRVRLKSLNKRVVENLIKCGALDSLGARRSQLMAVYEQAMELGQSFQKDNASGQMGLFGDEDFEELNTLRLPNLSEMPQSLLLKNEKELVGFYITGHPLDGYREALKSFTPLYTLMGETPAVEDGKFVTVAGIIAACNIKITKKGDSMAILTLEDFTGKLSIVVFPKSYSEYAQLLAQDTIIAVEGRFSIDERETKVIATQILPLVEGQPAPSFTRKKATGAGGYRGGALYGADSYGGGGYSIGSGYADEAEQAEYYSQANRVEEATAGYTSSRATAGAGTGSRANSRATGTATASRTGTAARGTAPPKVPFTYQQVPPGAVIYLKIAAPLENPATTRALMTIFSKYGGSNQVFLDLLGSRKRIRVEPKFYIDAANEQLQQELHRLLGPQGMYIKA